MIRFGPAGIPLSCKGRTLRDGISDVHHLGLTAMEVQFIKVNPLTRVVLDEEVGQVAARTSPSSWWSRRAARPRRVGPSRETARRARSSVGTTSTTLTWSLAKDHADLAQTKALAQALDVDLTLHAPYYVDFFGSRGGPGPLASARSSGRASSPRASGRGSTVTHLGFYGGGDRADSVQELTEIARELSEWLKQFSKGAVRLAIEPSGHPTSSAPGRRSSSSRTRSRASCRC